MRDVADALPPTTVERLRAFRRELENKLPGVIADVLLFGSRARGEARPDSDFDLAVLVRGHHVDELDVRRIVLDAAYEHVVDGYFFAPMLLLEDYLGASPSDLAQRIRRDGVLVSP